jgi:CIC family chloride channel protein
VADLLKPAPVTVIETARFSEIGHAFIQNRFNYLYVVDAQNKFRGAVSLHDIKSYLNEPDLSELVIARDIMREDFQTIGSGATLAEALDQFLHHDGERLPVVDSEKRLVGSISKTDIILALAERGGEAGVKESG